MSSSLHKTVPRRAILIFANQLDFDLAARRLPEAARPFLNSATISLQSSCAADVHVFSPGPFPAIRGQHRHQQVGRTFAARFEHAIEAIAALGYDEIAAIGRDCPALRGRDIALAFSQLGTKRIVLGPDHRGGCYLIAFRAAERTLLRGVRWLRNTDCIEILERFGKDEATLLPLKHDVDSWADVRLLSKLGGAISALAAMLVRTALAISTERTHFVDLAAQFVRIRRQIPPPGCPA